ncbi:MAG: hypothetical protein LQ347_005274, partial [Umbilicaria vellea]
LSRPSLIGLALQWLSPSLQQTCAPHLADRHDHDGAEEEDEDEDQGIYAPAQSLEELREIYAGLGARRGGKREVLDRILEGDWRHGVSLQQLAMADVRYLGDHPTALRWTALKLVRVKAHAGSDSGYETGAAMADEDGEAERAGLPRFHAASFVQNLQREVGPVVKAHFYFTRVEGMEGTLLRVWICDSPYSGQRAVVGPASTRMAEGAKTIYAVFPDGTDAVYVSLASTPGQTGGGDGNSLRRVVLEAIPKALSRPHERYTLKTTSLSARSLSALLAVRGPGRGNAAAGGWSIFAEGTVDESPLKSVSATSEPLKEDDEDEKEDLSGPPTLQSRKRAGRPTHNSKLLRDLGEPAAKRRKLVAKLRFGETALDDDQKGIERLEIRVEDPFPAERTGDPRDVELATPPEAVAAVSRRGRRSTLSMLDDSVEDEGGEAEAPLIGWVPDIRLTFSGSHVFAGMRKLVECGAIDGEKMPGWMTGEAGISIGVIRGGRVKGNKDSDRIPSNMSRVAPLAYGDTGKDDGDIMDVSDAKENYEDNEENEDMGVTDGEDGASNDEEVQNEEEDHDQGIIKASNAKEPIAEDFPAARPAATTDAKHAGTELTRVNHVGAVPDDAVPIDTDNAGSEAIDAADEQVVYFYGRNDSTQKLYQLPLYKADTWMGLRRYLGPLVSQTGRFKIWGPDGKEIAEVFWKPYPKIGKTFSFIYSELIFVTVLSTNSTAMGYSLFPITIIERTFVHELRSVIHWEMRRQRWRTPERADALELDVFLVVDHKPCLARMSPHHLLSHYLQGKSEHLKIKVRNLEARKEGEMDWPVWDERLYWA